jgi:hypothetical protein
VAVLGLVGVCFAIAPTAPARAAVDSFTPAILRVMSQPTWFRGTDGRLHLAYELEITNAFPVGITITAVNAIDARQERPVSSLTGEDLAASMSLLTSGSASSTALEPSTVGVVWFDLPFDSPRQIPTRLEHRVTLQVEPGLPVPATIEETGARTDVDRRPPIVIGSPLEGAGWLAVGSCCDGPHARAVQPVNGGLHLGQRFAIDFNRLDDRDFIATGDPSLNTSWPTYGQPVLAVADATVVTAVDEFADQTPGADRPVTIEEADGNYVILELGARRFAFYAHLKPGSVSVKRGERVRVGQVIAETGNSGSSTGPHLHFQLMDRPSALASNGVAYGFDRFGLDGRSPPLDELLTIDPASTPVPIDRSGAGPRRGELPLGRDLVAFGAARR